MDAVQSRGISQLSTPHRAESLLACATRPEWAPAAADELTTTLIDHAHCEKKAAASALALINDYPEDTGLVSALARLAEEELGHFREVHAELGRQGLTLDRDRGDPYVRSLLAFVRQPNDQRKLDRLLVCALIEARSCERFRLLARELTKRAHPLATWFTRLEASEAGHAALFVHLARERFGSAAELRLAELTRHEAEIVEALPLLPRIH